MRKYISTFKFFALTISLLALFVFVGIAAAKEPDDQPQQEPVIFEPLSGRWTQWNPQQLSANKIFCQAFAPQREGKHKLQAKTDYNDLSGNQIMTVGWRRGPNGKFTDFALKKVGDQAVEVILYSGSVDINYQFCFWTKKNPLTFKWRWFTDDGLPF